MLESPSSSVGSLDPASPRMRAGGDNNGGFYVTMTPLNSNSKVSVSVQICINISCLLDICLSKNKTKREEKNLTENCCLSCDFLNY